MIIVLVLVGIGVLIGYFLFSPNADAGEAFDTAREVIDTAEKGKDFITGNDKADREPTIIDFGPELQPEELTDTLPTWQLEPLADIRTGTPFTIANFRGRLVLVHATTPTCESCITENALLQDVQAALGDQLVTISLLEDSLPLQTAQAYAQETTLRIVAQGSPTMRSAMPEKTITLVCADGNYRQLNNPIESSEQLIQELAAGCY